VSALWLAGCASSVRIAEIKTDPGRFDHKTVAGRETFIRTHGKPGVTYAVALRWPTGGWVAADPVTVPKSPTTTQGDKHVTQQREE